MWSTISVSKKEIEPALWFSISQPKIFVSDQFLKFDVWNSNSHTCTQARDEWKNLISQTCDLFILEFQSPEKYLGNVNYTTVM